jgi:hypothetical protein
LEARGGIEPPIRVLQTLALPLGDRATVAFTLPLQLNPELVIEPFTVLEPADPKAQVERQD